MKTTITSKGHLTLPRGGREVLGLRAGDELVVRLEGRVVLLSHHRYRAQDLLQLIPKKPRRPSLALLESSKPWSGT